MKRIKSLNGYTIYEATTQRDVDNYGCQIGSYNIYLSSDIRDYGLSYSSAEWEDIDSLATAIAMCNGSQWATACALAEEISGSTCQDMDLCLEIERRLDAGEALSDVRADLRKVYLDEDEDEDDDLLDLDKVYEKYGLEFRDDDELDGDLEDVLDEALSAGDRATHKHWTITKSARRNAYYYCDCCGCLIGMNQIAHCAESDDNDFMVFCDRCIGKQDFLHDDQCPVEPEPQPAVPKQEPRSHASYAVVQDPDDGQYYTIASPSTSGLDTPERRNDWLLATVAKHYAFSDCGGYDVIEVVVDGRRVEYVGWQPGMLYEFRDISTGEIVWSCHFPEWDH